MAVERFPACRAELEKRADLTQYTTTIAVDDADEVRDALGYDKIDLVGGSYGSLASLVYLGRHPAHVRAVAIEGVASADYRLPLPFAKTIQSSLDHLFANCAADAGCHKDFPDLKTEFETIVKRLNAAPARFDFPHGPAEKAQSITLSRGAFVSNLRAILYQPALVSQLPYILDRAYQNDWSLYTAAAVAMQRAVADDIARGMAFSVICGESVPFISEADIRRETQGTYLGDFDVRIHQRNCQLWQHAPDASPLAPVHSDVPVLMISGAEDPATPPEWAERAAQTLSHARVVPIPHGTHLTGGACIDKMIAQFIQAASGDTIDTGCVSKIERPPFLTLDQVKKLRAQSGQ
jgi:pimeloyl-ACP methyl ester carboxylesterase